MFMNAYAGIPKIATVWIAALSHEGLEAFYHTDDQFLDMFKRNEKHFDNSLLFFMGDHGPRYSNIHTVRLGRYENRNPFLLVALPKMLRGTTVHEELKAKSMQLMTPFDLHATDPELQRKLGTFVAQELNRELARTGYGKKCMKQGYKKAIDIEELNLGTNTLYTVYVELKPSDGLFS
ncbi:hypothetical protein TELCIR_18950, partial [Teladorsagia circumcincta]